MVVGWLSVAIRELTASLILERILAEARVALKWRFSAFQRSRAGRHGGKLNESRTKVKFRGGRRKAVSEKAPASLGTLHDDIQ